MMLTALTCAAATLLAGAVGTASAQHVTGLSFHSVTQEAIWVGREDAQIALLQSPQTFYDLATSRFETFPPYSLLLYGGTFDCVSDVWLSPANNRTDWRLISGYTSYDGCFGPFILSHYPQATWLPAEGMTNCNFNDQMFVFGGWDPKIGDKADNTFWSSSDRINWTQTANPPAFPGRSSSSCAILNTTQSPLSLEKFSPRSQALLAGANANADQAATSSAMFIIAGAGDYGYLLNDVWRSDDQGQTWNLVNSNPGFMPRYYFMSAAISSPKNNYLFVMGGQVFNASSFVNETVQSDVWRSSDMGVSWQQLTAAAAWPPRARSKLIATPEGVLILVAGSYTIDMGTYYNWGFTNEIWASFDFGMTFANCTANSTAATFAGRELPAATLDEMGRLVVTSGLDDFLTSGFNDIWTSDISVRDTRNFAAACGVLASSIHPDIAATMSPLDPLPGVPLSAIA